MLCVILISTITEMEKNAHKEKFIEKFTKVATYNCNQINFFMHEFKLKFEQQDNKSFH